MLRARLIIKPMVQMVLTVDPKIRLPHSATGDQDIDDVIQRLEKQFGGEGKPPMVTQDYIEAFSDVFLRFLMKERIDAVVHFFVVEEGRFTATIIVTEREGKLVEKWFKEFFENMQ